MKEKAFENKLTRWLQSVGIYRLGTPKQNRKVETKGNYFKVWGGGFQQAGIPDLICNINGYFVALELKGESGRPTKLQELNIKDINEGNAIGLIVYPKDYSDLQKLIKGLIQ